MKKLLVAGLMVVLASPAFAAIQNVKVSGDITTSYIYDNSLDIGAQAGSPGLPAGQKRQSLFLTQTRLRVDADLSDNVSTTVGLINERAWNAEGGESVTGTNQGYDTNVQLYLASLTLREFLYSPLTLQIGRQVFNYGNGFIMGDGGPVNSGSGNLAGIFADLNERTAYDGVTATLDYKPLTISMIYFKNGQTTSSILGTGHINGANSNGQSSDVYGYNANYQLSDAFNTVIEQYTFARVNGSGFSSSISQTVDKESTLFVPGLRVSTNPVKGLNVQGEIAWELGQNQVLTNGNSSQQEGERRDAMAGQFLASYALPVLDKYKPTVNASFTYASGDKNGNQNYNANHVSSSKTYSAWDQFNTIEGAGTIYREIFNMSDEEIASVGASFSPLEDVTAGFTWSGIWAPVAYTNGAGSGNPLTLVQPDGTTTAVITTNGRGTWVGNETDVNLTYNYTEDVTFGLSMGWFVPGDVFANNNHDLASQAIANVGVKF